jgi:phosphoglycolate phosphatase
LVGRALECSGNADTTEIAAFRSAYAEYPGAPEDLYPGIVDALTALRHADVTLGVCTNKPQALSEHVLNATGIAAHFTAVVGGDATPRTKPDAAHVLHTLSNMGCDGLPFDFIGDSSIDARAARACDARFLWAAWGYADATDLGHYGRRLLAPSELTAAILEAACA